MKKFFLLIFIVFDVVVFAAACLLIYNRLSERSNETSRSMAGAPAHPATSPAGVQASSVTASATPVTPPAAPAEAGTRNIKFSYRNSKAKEVAIRADFTGWKAEPMHKEGANTWVFQAALPPGEYAYCYTVDGRAIRDPVNKRSKLIGSTTVSSILVNPLPARAAAR